MGSRLWSWTSFVASGVATSVAAVVLLSAGAAADGGSASRATHWTSMDGRFRVSYMSRLEPLVINRIHSWDLHVETADGEPVADAKISVAGGMPAHDHGLPTEPEVTRSPADGDYLLEGLRFHMNGDWEIELTIEACGSTDTVVIPLTL